MLISILLIIISYIHYHNIKNSKSSKTKNIAKRLIIASWIFLTLELIFVILVYHKSKNKILVILFPIFSYFFNESPMDITNLEKRKLFWQPKPKQLETTYGKRPK